MREKDRLGVRGVDCWRPFLRRNITAVANAKELPQFVFLNLANLICSIALALALSCTTHRTLRSRAHVRKKKIMQCLSLRIIMYSRCRLLMLSIVHCLPFFANPVCSR